MLSKKTKYIIILFFIGFLIRFGLAVISIDHIPQSYGWYRIAQKVIKGEKTLMTAYYSVANDKILKSRYYLVRPPMHILFYVMIIEIFNESVFWYILLQSLISAATVLVSYKLFSLIFNSRISFFGALIVCINPYFISRVWNSSEANLYLLFILTAFYFFFKFKNTAKGAHLLYSAIFFGLAYLTRSTIFFFLIALIPFFLLDKPRFNYRILIKFIFTIVLTILPWLIYNFSIYNKIILSDHGGSRFWVANNKYVLQKFPATSIDDIEHKMWRDLSSDEYELLKEMHHLGRENYLKNKAIEYMMNEPISYIQTVLKKIFAAFTLSYNPRNDLSKNIKKRDLVHYSFYLPLFLIGTIGIIFFYKDHPYPSLFFILYFCSLIIVASIFWAHTRHTIPYQLTFIFGTLLLLNHCRWFSKTRKTRHKND